MKFSPRLPRFFPIAPLGVIGFAICAFSMSTNAATLLVGFDTFPAAKGNLNNHTANAAGFTATLTGGDASRNQGSTDGSYGSFGSGASTSTTNGAFTIRNPSSNTDNIVTLVLTNNSGTTYNLLSYNFDISDKGSSNTPEDLALSISGGIGTASGPLTGINYGITTFDGVSGDYDDRIYDLTGLSIADGTSITFTMTESGGAANDSAFLDNFAIVGVAVPEPGTITLFGFAGLLLAVRRRR